MSDSHKVELDGITPLELPCSQGLAQGERPDLPIVHQQDHIAFSGSGHGYIQGAVDRGGDVW